MQLVKQQIVAIVILVFFSASVLSAEVITVDGENLPAAIGVDSGRAAITREVTSPVCRSPLVSDVQTLDAQVFEVDNALRGGFNAFDPSGPVLINRAEPFLPPLRFELYEPTTLIPMGYGCNAAQLGRCEADARFRYSTCVLEAPNQTHTKSWFCLHRFEVEQDECLRTYGCPANYDCVSDAQRADPDYCCPYGMESCGGVCRRSCNLSQRRNTATCACECLSNCRPPLVNDPETCACKCPNRCPTGFMQDPRTCECYCPDGLNPCGDRCVNFQVDRKNCGSCGTACGPQEDCCFGSCESLNQDANCGRCGNDCSIKGGSCCARSCVELETDNNNCGSCGRKCGERERCCNGTCVNINTVNNCGACGRKCGAGQDCCNGQCTSLDTVANCGSCGNACPSAQICEEGVSCAQVPLICAHGGCICPLQWEDCSIPGSPTFCCPPDYSCNRIMIDGHLRSLCCPHSYVYAIKESPGPLESICCSPELVLDRGGTKFCCPRGSIPAIGADTLAPVCCSGFTVEGEPRLVIIEGRNFCLGR